MQCEGDSGVERQIGDFVNSQSLWEIIGTLFPEKVLDLDSDAYISCLYMRTEVCLLFRNLRTKLTTNVNSIFYSLLGNW